MTNHEGFLFIVLFASFFMLLVGCITLASVYFVFSLVKNKLFRVIIILTGTVLNFTLFMNGSDVSWLIIGAVCFAVPMTVLAPLILIPDRLKVIPTFSRILMCYFIISVLDTILPFVLVATGIYMIPFLYWATPFSNGFVYTCLMIGCFGVSVTVYQLINKFYDDGFFIPIIYCFF